MTYEEDELLDSEGKDLYEYLSSLRYYTGLDKYYIQVIEEIVARMMQEQHAETKEMQQENNALKCQIERLKKN